MINAQQQEFERLNKDFVDPGLSAKTDFDISENIAAPYINNRCST